MGDATARAEHAIDSGEALERFRRMVEAQGGDPRVADDPWAVLPRAPVVRSVLADRAGTLATVDAEAMGQPAWRWAPGGCARATRSTPPWVSWCGRSSVSTSIDGASIGEVHAG